MTPSGGVAARDRQIIKLWEELGFKLSVADDVRGGWLLLLGGVASKITAHTPARNL